MFDRLKVFFTKAKNFVECPVCHTKHIIAHSVPKTAQHAVIVCGVCNTQCNIYPSAVGGWKFPRITKR